MAFLSSQRLVNEAISVLVSACRSAKLGVLPLFSDTHLSSVFHTTAFSAALTQVFSLLGKQMSSPHF